jgi:hypothetical protein
MNMADLEIPHLFNQKYPTLGPDEEIEWLRHPYLPLQCNQLGLIVMDDGVVWTSSNGCLIFEYKDEHGNLNKKRASSDERIVYECYFGTISPFCWIYQKNGNPYDLRPENLVVIDRKNPEHKELRAKKSAFLYNTAEYMASKIPMLERRGIDPEYYWDLMCLPKEVMKVYYKYMDLPQVEKKKINFRLSGEDKDYAAKKCYELREQGKTYEQIAKSMGLSNLSYARNLILYHESKLDI